MALGAWLGREQAAIPIGRREEGVSGHRIAVGVAPTSCLCCFLVPESSAASSPVRILRVKDRATNAGE